MQKRPTKRENMTGQDKSLESISVEKRRDVLVLPGQTRPSGHPGGSATSTRSGSPGPSSPLPTLPPSPATTGPQFPESTVSEIGPAPTVNSSLPRGNDRNGTISHDIQPSELPQGRVHQQEGLNVVEPPRIPQHIFFGQNSGFQMGSITGKLGLNFKNKDEESGSSTSSSVGLAVKDVENILETISGEKKIEKELAAEDIRVPITSQRSHRQSEIKSITPPVGSRSGNLSLEPIGTANIASQNTLDHVSTYPICALILVCYRMGTKGVELHQIQTVLESRFKDNVDFQTTIRRTPSLISTDAQFFQALRNVYLGKMCGFWRRTFFLKTLRGIQLLSVRFFIITLVILISIMQN